ncbi:AroM protein [Bacillus sp. JCM 19045]|nr:AroM protein [Bacillus sp. JCM 19045]
MRTIGLLTIGQSPRIDMTPEMERYLEDELAFVEAGALDSLSQTEIDALQPEEQETTYISRLRNGSSAVLSKEKMLPYLQSELTKLEEKAASTIVVCTGSFPSLVYQKPVLFPDKLLVHVVEATIGQGTLGTIIPLEEQREQLIQKWNGRTVQTAVANPYTDENVESAATELAKKGVSLIVLDCMGYTKAHKERVQKQVDVPVILARSIVARIAAELT